jgi:hypothetical protein
MSTRVLNWFRAGKSPAAAVLASPAGGEPHGRLRPPRREGPRTEFAGRRAPIQRESNERVPGNLHRGGAALTMSLFHATCGKPPRRRRAPEGRRRHRAVFLSPCVATL